MYADSLKKAVELFYKKQATGKFPGTKSNTGRVVDCDEIVVTPKERRGLQETASYELAKGAKASVAVRKLIESKRAGCEMTCQMAVQLCTYYAILDTWGEELFDKVFTDTFPFILRDFHISAGQAFIPGYPYHTCFGDQMGKVQSHPLAIFFHSADTKTAKKVGDFQVFQNFPDYIQLAFKAQMVFPGGANMLNRNDSSLCIDDADIKTPGYFVWNTGTKRLDTNQIADIMLNAYNHNAELLNNSGTNVSKKSKRELMSLEAFEPKFHHARFNEEMLYYIQQNPEQAAEQISLYANDLKRQKVHVNMAFLQRKSMSDDELNQKVQYAGRLLNESGPKQDETIKNLLEVMAFLTYISSENKNPHHPEMIAPLHNALGDAYEKKGSLLMAKQCYRLAVLSASIPPDYPAVNLEAFKRNADRLTGILSADKPRPKMSKTA